MINTSFRYILNKEKNNIYILPCVAGRCVFSSQKHHKKMLDLLHVTFLKDSRSIGLRSATLRQSEHKHLWQKLYTIDAIVSNNINNNNNDDDNNNNV